ncbi:unnamed protein product [Protopolystoma xenopodis]|uniref:Uncharacterized protein n=1 Tax=Protopolystoma xenopodis TaxID=117903 RepID=A0A448X2K9_9PLAT|nr:unnamed protein product [Protopolystoma xenopodis]
MVGKTHDLNLHIQAVIDLLPSVLSILGPVTGVGRQHHRSRTAGSLTDSSDDDGCSLISRHLADSELDRFEDSSMMSGDRTSPPMFGRKSDEVDDWETGQDGIKVGSGRAWKSGRGRRQGGAGERSLAGIRGNSDFLLLCRDQMADCTGVNWLRRRCKNILGIAGV